MLSKKIREIIEMFNNAGVADAELLLKKCSLSPTSVYRHYNNLLEK